MAVYDPYSEQLVGLRNQQALAQKLRESAQTPSQGQMVSGWYVAPNALGELAKGLNFYSGLTKELQAEKQIKDLGEQRKAENAAWLASAPTEQTYQVEDRSALPAAQQTQMGPSPYSKALRVKPTTDETLAWAMKAPGLDTGAVAQLGVKGAELEAGRQARLGERQLAIEAEAKRDRERAQDRLDQIKFAASMRPPAPEPLVAVLGPDNKPVMMPRSQAGGMTPANAQTMGATSPQQRVQDANDAMSILRQAAPLVNKSTSSGVGTAADYVAGLAGYSTPGADTAADLKVLGGALVSKMPKMSGPQSDKDVALYKEMAGKLGDSTVPASQKRSAMQTLMNLQAKYAGVAPETLTFDGTAKSANDILMQADAIIGGGK
jgi:hypothetical protein